MTSQIALLAYGSSLNSFYRLYQKQDYNVKLFLCLEKVVFIWRVYLVTSGMGANEKIDHFKDRADGYLSGFCKCTVCGEITMNLFAPHLGKHEWDGAICKLCGTVKPGSCKDHTFDAYCKCTVCGIQEHEFINDVCLRCGGKIENRHFSYYDGVPGYGETVSSVNRIVVYPDGTEDDSSHKHA